MAPGEELLSEDQSEHYWLVCTKPWLESERKFMVCTEDQKEEGVVEIDQRRMGWGCSEDVCENHNKYLQGVTQKQGYALDY